MTSLVNKVGRADWRGVAFVVHTFFVCGSLAHLIGLSMMESGLFGDDGTKTFLPFLMMSPGNVVVWRVVDCCSQRAIVFSGNGLFCLLLVPTVLDRWHFPIIVGVEA
jgi:hypothetical protein